MTAQDLPAIRQLAHALKGAAEALCVESLSCAAFDLEISAAAGSSASTAAALRLVRDAGRTLVARLERILDDGSAAAGAAIEEVDGYVDCLPLPVRNPRAPAQSPSGFVPPENG